MENIIDIYKDLLDQPDILHSICQYIANSNNGLIYNFGSTVLKQGTKLYRIRTYRENTDYTNLNEWLPSPKKSQNRCNAEGETAIYLGSHEEVCLLETHTKQNSKYVLGEYTVTQDIQLGGFNYVKPDESKWKMIVAMAYNAFLIAPVRNEKNKELFEFLDEFYADDDYDSITLKSVVSKYNMNLPFRLGHLYSSEKYFNFTNMLCSILKKNTPSGIRYSSCFIPAETVGIECSHYNVVLYDDAISYLKFEKPYEKTNISNATPVGIAKSLLVKK